MRIAVIGGTGVAGRHTVDSVRRAGHEALVVSRARGVDVSIGAGLDEARWPASTRSSTSAACRAPTRSRRGASSRPPPGISSPPSSARGCAITCCCRSWGVDRIEGNAHFAGKRTQEELLFAGPVPVTIQRVTQFHEFAETVVAWTRQGDVASIPPLLVQPVAAADVGDVLAEIAGGDPQGRATDLAGPEPQDFVDMARRAPAARGESIRLLPSWRTGVFGIDAAGEMLLPGPDARLAPTTFDAWLARWAAAPTT